MSELRRWVVDTNALVSRLLLPDSTVAQALVVALELGDFLVSNDTLEELSEVLARPKFDRFVTSAERVAFFHHLAHIAIHVQIVREVRACRDPKDDKFLAVAVNGAADAIITGDEDLLVLHPFMGVPILSPQAFLSAFGRA